MSNNTVKKKRKDFADRLAEKLKEIGPVDVGALSDGSGRWVTLRQGKMSINFSFDIKGEKVSRVGLYQEVWQKVSEDQIFSFQIDRQPKSKP